MLKFLSFVAIVTSSIVYGHPAQPSASSDTISLDDFEIIKLIARGSKSGQIENCELNENSMLQKELKFDQ